MDKLPQYNYDNTEPFVRAEEARRKIHGPLGRGMRLPRLPYEYWLKPAGNVVALPIGTTRNWREAEQFEIYGIKERARKLRQGWIPWEYDLAKKHAPLIVGDLDEAGWKVKREELLKERRDRHNEQTNEWRRQHREEMQAMAAQGGEIVARMMREALRNLQQDKPAKGKKTEAE